MTKILIIFTLSILTSACQSDKADDNDITNTFEEEPKTKYCNNQLQLITADTLPTMEIDFNQNPDTIFSFIESTLKQDICDQIVYLGLHYDTQTKKTFKTNNSIPLLVRVRKYCDMAWCHIPPRMTILMNAKGQLLIENRIGNKDSLETWTSYHYFDAIDPLIDNAKNAFFILHWDKEVNKDSLTSVFSSVVDGYLNAADRYSRQLFEKNICELTLAQADTIKGRMPFNFELSLGVDDLVKPPPPPPIIE